MASVLAVVNPENNPAYSGAVGSVEGTVFVVGDPPKREPFSASERRKCVDPIAEDAELSFRESPLEGGKRGLRDVLVYAVQYDGFVAEREPTKEISIHGCEYSRRTLDLTFGQSILVQNDDKGPYAPSLSKSPNPVLGLAPPKGHVELYPRELGPLALGVRVGPGFTRAAVYVLPQPLHAVSRENGRFRIDGIPIGAKIGLRFRHPVFAEEVGREVEIRNGVVSHVDAELRAGQ